MTDGRFAISLHILTLLARSPGQLLCSEEIASSVNINPVLVRKALGALKNSGLIHSKEGQKGGSELARPAPQILLSDIYKSLNKVSVLGWPKNHPNENCPVGCHMFDHLQQIYDDVEATLIDKLSGMTLADFTGQFN